MKWFIQVRVKKGELIPRRVHLYKCLYKCRPNRNQTAMAVIPKRGTVGGEERGECLLSALCVSVLFEDSLLSALCVSVLFKILFVCLFCNEHVYYHFENKKYVHQENGIEFKLWSLQDCYSLHQGELGLFVKMNLSDAGYIFHLWLLFPWLLLACLKIHMFLYVP